MSNPVDILCDALAARRSFVNIRALRSIKTLIGEAYRRDPRLVAAMETWECPYKKNISLFDMTTEYRLKPTYYEDLPPHDQIILDDGSWTPSAGIRAGHDPQAFHIVSNDAAGLEDRIRTDMQTLRQLQPEAMEWTLFSRGEQEGYTYCVLTLRFPLPAQQYRQLKTLASRQTATICRRFFGLSAGGLGTMIIPEPLKAFLAFSYLQQHCTYHDQAEATRDSESPVDPWADTAYGPLCRQTGTALGIALAYQMLLQHLGMDCSLLRGGVIDNAGQVTAHVWCQVKIGNACYHVDPSWDINSPDVPVEYFLQSDRNVSITHVWDMDAYAECTAGATGYPSIARYITDHFSDLIAAGVDENYINLANVAE